MLTLSGLTHDSHFLHSFQYCSRVIFSYFVLVRQAIGHLGSREVLNDFFYLLQGLPVHINVEKLVSICN